MTDNERLKKVIELEGMTTNAFGKYIGLNTSQVLYDVLKGRNGISKELAEKISASCLNINIGWLLTGEGNMLKSSEEEISPSPPIDKDSLTNIDILVKVIDKLSESDERNSKSIEIMNENMKELIAQGRDQVDNITKLVNLLCQSGVDIANPVIDKEKRGLKTSGKSDRSSATDAEHADVG